MNLNRRRFLGTATATAATSGVAAEWLRPKYSIDLRKARSSAAVLTAEAYSDRLEQQLFEGLIPFRLSVSGKSVLLKPNLVEDLPGPVSTNPLLVGAAARCFLRMGARRVVVGDGPGHQRDTELVVRSTGLEQQLAERGIEFIDLNRDEVGKVELRANYSGLRELWFPRTVLGSDFIVSMPKIKTHHWVGVTLSLKNMFGVVPGIKYGWPKNPLHWHGIHESILDICATVPIHFVIADGIEAMEGNGPLHGTVRQLNRIVLADDPVAADATCARLMGFEPGRVRHIAEASRFLGNQEPARIRQLGDRVPTASRPFAVLPDFEYLISHSGRGK